jgi:hypothetical protein
VWLVECPPAGSVPLCGASVQGHEEQVPPVPALHVLSTVQVQDKYKTKQAHNGILRHTRDLGLEINQDSFKWRAAKSYNELPLEIKNIPTLEGFRKGVKTWMATKSTYLMLEFIIFIFIYYIFYGWLIGKNSSQSKIHMSGQYVPPPLICNSDHQPC